jgi:hypothetical protein
MLQQVNPHHRKWFLQKTAMSVSIQKNGIVGTSSSGTIPS